MRLVLAVEALADDVSAAERRMLLQLGTLIDDRQDWPAAAGQVRALMVVARFAADELAALAVGGAAYITVFIGLMGVVLALGPLVAAAGAAV